MLYAIFVVVFCGAAAWAQSVDFESSLRVGQARAISMIARQKADSSAERAAALAALSDDNPYVRSESVQALAPYAGEEAVRVALLQKLDDGDLFVRAAAVDALASLAKDEPVRSALLKKMQDDGIVRVQAVKALTPLVSSDEEIRAAIVAELRDEGDLYSRDAAFDALKPLAIAGDVRAKAAVVACLDAKEPKARGSAVLALREMALTDTAVAAKVKRLLDDPDLDVRIDAGIVMAPFAANDSEVKARFLKNMKSSDPIEQFSGLINLESCVAGDPEVRQAVLALLADKSRDEEARRRAIVELAPLIASDPAVRAAVEAYRDDGDLVMRVTARQALEGLFN